MCLRISHRNLKTIPTHKEGEPSKERVVYKILITDGKNYRSPYIPFNWALEEVTNDVKDPIIRTVKPKRAAKYRIVTAGFFHAYRTSQVAIEKAKELANREDFKKLFSKNPYYNLIIQEAVIPEGTKYYEGTHGDICAKSLKILNKNVPILESESLSGS